MIRTVVSINSRNVSRRLQNIQKNLSKMGSKSTKDIGRWTRDKLIQNISIDTGNTARSIGIIKEVHSKGEDEVIVGLRYLPLGSGNGWKKESSNLFDFMMNSPMAITGFYPYGNTDAQLVHFRKDINKLRNVPLEAADKFRKRVIIETKEILK